MTSAGRRVAAMAAGVALCALAPGDGHTEEFAARYTSTAPKNCKTVKTSRSGEGEWRFGAVRASPASSCWQAIPTTNT